MADANSDLTGPNDLIWTARDRYAGPADPIMQSFRSNAVRIFLTLTLAFPRLAAAGTLRVLAWPEFTQIADGQDARATHGSRVELTLMIASDQRPVGADEQEQRRW